MKLTVFDTETSGIGPTDEIMELAAVLIEPVPEGGWGETFRWSSLVRPSVPCTLEALATHHITKAMTDESWSVPEMLERRPLEEFEAPCIPVAHNLKFDMAMMKQSGITLPEPGICTWRCALHLYPDSPRHSNQVLRYHLGLDDIYGDLTLKSLPPHRALPDAVITSRLLLEMLKLKTPEELVALTTAPVLLNNVGFGKHVGKTWAQVAATDSRYMRWILGEGPERQEGGAKKGFDEDLRYTCRVHLGLVAGPVPAPVVADVAAPLLL